MDWKHGRYVCGLGWFPVVGVSRLGKWLWLDWGSVQCDAGLVLSGRARCGCGLGVPGVAFLFGACQWVFGRGVPGVCVFLAGLGL